MKKLFILASFLPLLISCIRGGEALAKLDDVFSYIESRPDSALTVLEGMNEDDLISKRSKAKHALLYSMALDKNWIDLASDSIIAPAVGYYNNHGSAEEKLLTYYYRGRISMNAGDYEEAISYFVLAERHLYDCSDKIMAGRLFKAQTRVYQYCYDGKGMTKAAERAAELYLSGQDTAKFINSQYDVVAGYLMQTDTTKAMENLDVLKPFWHKMNEKQKSLYYSSSLLLNQSKGFHQSESLIEEYLNEIQTPSNIKWLSVAKAYYLSGNHDKAQSSLQKYDLYEGLHNAAYFWDSGLIYEALGRNSEAAKSYRKYIDMTDEKLGYLLEADIRFIKEQYESKIMIQRKSHLLTVTSLCILILALVVIIITSRIRKIHEEKRMTEATMKKYRELYESAIQEIDSLKQALKDNQTNPTIKEQIIKRLTLLNRFIAAHITPTFSKTAIEELEKLMQNRNDFIESTRLSFLIENPRFVEYLKQKGLKEAEIGYCCLYAMGLKGKEIASYLGNSHYKQSSSIRKKLGLTEHDTNLDLYLRGIIAKLQSKSLQQPHKHQHP